MMYTKFANLKRRKSAVPKDGEHILMSAKEFADGGYELMGVPVTITPDGEEPAADDEQDGGRF